MGVPRTTLRNRIQGQESHTTAAESQQRLSKIQEKHLTTWILAQEALGVPLTHGQIRQFVCRLLVIKGDHKDLGKRWMEGFLRRNPILRTTRARTINSVRVNGATTSVIKGCFPRLAAVKSLRLAIRQVLIWQDLTQAARCIRSNRNNVDFWTNLRAIFLTVLEVYNAPDRRYYELGLCHWVFRDLYAILYKLLPSQGRKPPLRWLRLQLAVWQGLSKSDPLFYLSRMHSIPFVRFHACRDSSINNYIGKGVRDSVRRATARRPARGCTVPWVPLEDMEPGKAGHDWKRSALEQWQKRGGKVVSESEVYVAYLVKRYDVKYRSFKPID